MAARHATENGLRSRVPNSSVGLKQGCLYKSTAIKFSGISQFIAQDGISHTPALIKHRRPGPKRTKYGIPDSEWPTVVQRVMEQQESLRTVEAAYGVSHETIHRIVLPVQK